MIDLHHGLRSLFSQPVQRGSTLSGLLRVTRFSLERLFFSRRTLLLLAVAALPVLLAAGVQLAGEWLPDDRLTNDILYRGIFTLLHGHLLLLLIPLLYAVSLIGDEADGGTLVWLLTRPISRNVLLLGKFLAYLILAGMLYVPSLTGTYLVLHFGGGTDTLVSGSGRLLQDLGMLSAGLVAYGAVFTLFGLALKRPLLIGLLYAFGWEALITYVPGFIHKFTIHFYLRGLTEQVFENAAFLAALSERSPPALTSLLVLTLVTVVLLAVAIWIFRRREYDSQPASA